MCCRTNVYPLNIAIACEVLRVGQFKPSYTPPDSKHPTSWVRLVPEEGTSVTASFSEGEGLLSLGIVPSISTFGQHEHKRIASGICFEIAAKYAEKVDGEIIQRGLVGGCRQSGASGDTVLGRYPSQPMDWEHICVGFRQQLFPAEDKP